MNGYIGKQIGNYRIIAEIGRGSFGSVYRGEHLFLKNRIVAVKLLHTEHLASQQECDRFIREAQILEQLKHPSILSIIDVGVHEDSPYLVTEYLPNGSLRDRMKHQLPHHLPVQEIMTILLHIGQALHYAHEQRIIHRDLKPENILFNSQGGAQLADFGIATALTTKSHKSTAIIGTPEYMAPEQFQGTVSKESDQYALACLAYELFTGHLPFTGPNPISVGMKHVMEQPIPPRQINPNIPIAVEAVILKAMAKQRTDRYDSIKTFIITLQHALASIATNQPTIPTTRQSMKRLRLDIAQLTDVGRNSSHNCDNMAYVLPKDEEIIKRKGALFIVADGGTSPHSGEVASEFAVDTVTMTYYQDDSKDIALSLINAIKRANTIIHQRASENILRGGMRTTCVCAVLRGNMAYIANVGNSRAYVIRQGQVKQVSQDHSWVEEQVRAGLLTRDQARLHARRNVITRCLGTQANIEVDIFIQKLNDGDYLILCTDGLSGSIHEKDLRSVVEQYVPQESVYLLVERANESGGPDNITAIVVRILEIGS